MARKKQGHGPSQRGRPGKEWPKWKAVTSEADDRLPAPPPQPAAGDRHDGSAAAQRQPRGLLSLEPHVMTSRVSRQQTATPAVQCPAVLRPLPAALLRQSAVRTTHNVCRASQTDSMHVWATWEQSKGPSKLPGHAWTLRYVLNQSTWTWRRKNGAVREPLTKVKKTLPFCSILGYVVLRSPFVSRSSERMAAPNSSSQQK